MQIIFLEKTLKYDGSQLSSHFAFQELSLLGDSCVGFIGPCEVKLESMVDLEDVRDRAPIYSPSMLHFILESFPLDLKAGVLLQRLIISQILELLQERGVQGLRREGDDIFFQDKKLSVSIATTSPVSTLIHIGLNIKTEGVPVSAVGLANWGIDPVAFAKICLKKIQEEYLDVLKATWKVRGVP